ncbi:MAG: hypoxanthine phosphoribosyltransferase [Calditrichaeota bacterium]|nr:MAG: hypoxanthine phosphoribosyltransferase [Calditrichota bacterium]
MSSSQRSNLHIKPFELLLDQTTINKRVAELGSEITRDYTGKNPLIIGVLKGCFVFMSDLIRQIKLPVEVEFVSASSYVKGSKQEKEIKFVSAVPTPLKDRHILVVEGIVDSAKTAVKIVKEFTKEEPASVEIVTLIDKPASHREKIDLKYKGFTIGNEFLIGYGLDNTQRYRNLPFIGKLVDN